MIKIAPSILSADFSQLGIEAEQATSGGADYIHIDVMDGHFVPNISFGASVMKSLNTWNTAPYDVHLMVENPDDFIEDFVTEKTEYITVHQEACLHLNRTLSHIRSCGVKCGVSLNPATSIDTLMWTLPYVDLVLIMSVNPGFGGQQFLPFSVNKVQELCQIREKLGCDFQIEVDGGINKENIQSIVETGADILVAGSAIFGTNDPEGEVRGLKECL